MATSDISPMRQPATLTYFGSGSRKRLGAWLSSDLPGRDLLVIQIDGTHIVAKETAR